MIIRHRTLKLHAIGYDIFIANVLVF